MEATWKQKGFLPNRSVSLWHAVTLWEEFCRDRQIHHASSRVPGWLPRYVLRNSCSQFVFRGQNTWAGDSRPEGVGGECAWAALPQPLQNRYPAIKCSCCYYGISHSLALWNSLSPNPIVLFSLVLFWPAPMHVALCMPVMSAELSAV